MNLIYVILLTIIIIYSQESINNYIKLNRVGNQKVTILQSISLTYFLIKTVTMLYSDPPKSKFHNFIHANVHSLTYLAMFSEYFAYYNSIKISKIKFVEQFDKLSEILKKDHILK